VAKICNINFFTNLGKALQKITMEGDKTPQYYEQ